jgi:hypothetical protein
MRKKLGVSLAIAAAFTFLAPSFADAKCCYCYSSCWRCEPCVKVCYKTCKKVCYKTCYTPCYKPCWSPCSWNWCW